MFKGDIKEYIMMQTGYSNTLIPFRNGIIRQYNSGQYAEALGALKMINRYQWLNVIDAFDAVEVMWDDIAYTPEEIVGEWIGLTAATMYR
jgi:hypothetical protein